MAIELGTINAYELRLSAHRYAAGTAHARTINHDGVERDVGGNVVLRGEFAAELHHDGRSDGKAFIDRFALDDLLDTRRDEALLSVATVVGHNDNFVGSAAHFVLEDDELFAASSQDCDDAVARFVEGLHDGQHRRDAHTAASTDDGAEVLNVGGFSQGAYDVGHAVAFAEADEAG